MLRWVSVFYLCALADAADVSGRGSRRRSGPLSGEEEWLGQATIALASARTEAQPNKKEVDGLKLLHLNHPDRKLTVEENFRKGCDRQEEEYYAALAGVDDERRAGDGDMVGEIAVGPSEQRRPPQRAPRVVPTEEENASVGVRASKPQNEEQHLEGDSGRKSAGQPMQSRGGAASLLAKSKEAAQSTHREPVNRRNGNGSGVHKAWTANVNVRNEELEKWEKQRDKGKAKAPEGGASSSAEKGPNRIERHLIKLATQRK